jgi:hypothetical protein
VQRTVKQTVGVVVLVVACWAGVAGGASYLDPDMVGAFVDLTQKNKLVGDFANTLFELLQVDSNYICITQRLRSLDNYNSDDDLVARKYVATAKARGNTVRAYKPAVNQLIAKKFRSLATSTPMPNARIVANEDRALIEFDKSGRVVSFLARVVEVARTGIGTAMRQYNSIYLGPQNARALENILDNRILADNFLREL